MAEIPTAPVDHEHSGPVEDCEICRYRLGFELPPQLVEACAESRLIVFAGAGVSTETRAVLQDTFRDRIAAELPEGEPDESFPALMQRYTETKSRRELLQRIVERFDYIDAFPELRDNATRFHRELATLFYVQDIVTTNWDPYFEQETGALPFVTDKDFALSDMPGRRVFKIHGSVMNLGSIIATEPDYTRCYRDLNRNVVGATLKHLLATKSVLFVGYSFRDSDFSRIYRFIKNQMADVLPRSYVVSPVGPPAGAGGNDAQFIQTDASYFVERLKTELVPRGCLLPDEQWDTLPSALGDLTRRHKELYDAVDLRKLPAAVLCGTYQDGVIHAFERMIVCRATGEYSHVHHVERLISTYERRREELVREKRYHDAAYAEGYQNGLLI